MKYGKTLLDRAIEQAGSRYALSKITEIPQSHLSDAFHEKREVPASWVLKLARVAGVDPTEAMEMHDLERAEKKRARRLLSSSVVAGVAAICATFGTTDTAHATSLHAEQVNSVYIVSSWLRALYARAGRVFSAHRKNQSRHLSRPMLATA